MLKFLNFPNFFNFLTKKFGKILIPIILTELRSESFEWFGPSPIEPFNSGPAVGAVEREGRRFLLLLDVHEPEQAVPSIIRLASLG